MSPEPGQVRRLHDHGQGIVTGHNPARHVGHPRRRTICLLILYPRRSPRTPQPDRGDLAQL
jgi:hypothetical protein